MSKNWENRKKDRKIVKNNHKPGKDCQNVE